MSLAAAIHAFLAFVLAKVLAENIWLEVVILDGQLKVREAKQPKKVTHFKQSHSTFYSQ